MKKINLAITGCMGRMGQQLIKSSKLKQFLTNLSIWAIIVIAVMVVLYLVF